MVNTKVNNFQKWANITGVLGFILSVYLSLTLQILPALNKEEIVISLPATCAAEPGNSTTIEFPISNNLGYDVSLNPTIKINPETYSINNKSIPNNGILYHNRENKPNSIDYNLTFNNKGNYKIVLEVGYGKGLSLTKIIDCNVS